MTKIEQRDVQQARMAASMGMPDLAARILSAAWRSSMSGKAQRELHNVAMQLGVVTQPDYII